MVPLGRIWRTHCGTGAEVLSGHHVHHQLVLERVVHGDVPTVREAPRLVEESILRGSLAENIEMTRCK